MIYTLQGKYVSVDNCIFHHTLHSKCISVDGCIVHHTLHGKCVSRISLIVTQGMDIFQLKRMRNLTPAL